MDFESAFQRYGPGLKRLFTERLNGNAEQAEELCQQTWAAVWEALQQGRYDPAKSAISTFVYAVGHHLWIRHLRRGASAAGTAGDIAGLELSGDGEQAPVDAMRSAELIQRVREGLSGASGDLTEEERWVLRSIAEGVTDRELAKALKIAPSSAHARKQSALGKLRRFLGLSGPVSADDAERRGG